MRLSLDATNVQREKLIFEMIEPRIPGFSVESMEVDETNDDTKSTEKRKKVETPKPVKKSKSKKKK